MNILKEFENPTVDFDWFHFGENSTYKVAQELAAILVANINIDDLHGINDQEGVYWPSTVGTGGCGMRYDANSQGAQRAILASHFASYALRHYESCYLGLPEYQCLCDLLAELEERSWASHKLAVVEQNISTIKQVTKQFEVDYAKKVPGFLFTLIKNGQR